MFRGGKGTICIICSRDKFLVSGWNGTAQILHTFPHPATAQDINGPDQDLLEVYLVGVGLCLGASMPVCTASSRACPADAVFIFVVGPQAQFMEMVWGIRNQGCSPRSNGFLRSEYHYTGRPRRNQDSSYTQKTSILNYFHLA